MPAVSLDRTREQVVVSTTAMASPVRVRVPSSGDGADASAARVAAALFHEVERQCSRFDPGSDLGRVNEAPEVWHRVRWLCFLAVWEAADAYRWSGGRFDPRVLSDLVALGYDRWPPSRSAVPRARLARGRWTPDFDSPASRVRVGAHAIDLGGIGKGLAIRWASRRLGARGHLIEAGGDCYGAGCAPDGAPWRIGVEDPGGGEGPLAVLSVRDQACATSSIRLRRWAAGDRPVHHLIDPRTGRPGGDGLLSVTVVAPDPACAEVWSKILFLSGSRGIRAASDRHRVAACWVGDDGRLQESARMADVIVWRR